MPSRAGNEPVRCASGRERTVYIISAAARMLDNPMPVLSPAALLDEMPLDDKSRGMVDGARAEVRAVLDGSDGRLLVVAGPCSVHDPAAALDYADRLRVLRDRHHQDLLIVMRVYFEKPRTVYRSARPAGGLRVAGPDHAAVHRGRRDPLRRG
jgi:hypothetical protein